MKTMVLASAAAFLALSLQEAPKPAPKTPELGKPAPLFRLNDHAGRTVPFGGKRSGWTVLAFFPKAATPG